MTSYIYGQVKATNPNNPFAAETQTGALADYRPYVDVGFQSMLGRAPGEIGYDYWTKDLIAGQHHYSTTQGLSQTDAFQRSLADFFANLARHAPGTTNYHDANTPGFEGKTQAQINAAGFAGEFAPTDPNATDVTGSSSPYADIINTAYSRIHGRTAGAIGMDYWGTEMASQVANGMSVDEATAKLYQNLVLNPEAKSNLIDGEGPNLQPKQTTNNYYGSGGGKTNVILAGNNNSPTAADQMKLSQPDPLVNQASTRDDYGRAIRQNRQGIKAGGTGGLNIGGLG